MEFGDICLITGDVARLSAFYAALFGVVPDGDAIHTVLRLPGLALTLYNREEAQRMMGFDFGGAGTGLFTLDFTCADAWAEYERVRALGLCNPTEPRLWPWGAVSFRFADPDGNIVLMRSRPEGRGPFEP